MRYKSIDALKVICAFLIVCIHIPFNIIGGGYYVALTRIGVPIFLMISGYFYKQDQTKRQIKKIAILFLEANIMYFLWNLIYGLLSGNNLVINLKSLVKFVLLNESPFSGHLWYLGAILYTLIIVYLLDKIGCKKIMYWITPVLLIGDLIIGKYSILIFGREFPYIVVRNWLFVGIPYFSIGMLMQDERFRIGKWGIPVFALTTVLERYLLVSNGLNATRDQYISTTFLAIAVFSFALDYQGNVSDTVAKIGRDYSTWIYIIHPIFITCFGYVVSKIGLQYVWWFVGPIVVFLVSLMFVASTSHIKNKVI